VGAVAGAGPARSAPFEQPTPEATDRPDLKVQAKYLSRGPRHDLAAPVVEVELPVGPGVETSLGLSRLTRENGLATLAGITDLKWGAKWEAVHWAGGFLTLAPELTLPTGAHQLTRGWALELPAVVGVARGPVRLSAMVAWSHGFRDGDDVGALSVLVYRRLTPRLGAGVELAADLTPTHAPLDEARLNLGAKWRCTPDLTLAARIGHSVAHRSTRPGSTAAALYLTRFF